MVETVCKKRKRTKTSSPTYASIYCKQRRESIKKTDPERWQRILESERFRKKENYAKKKRENQTVDIYSLSMIYENANLSMTDLKNLYDNIHGENNSEQNILERERNLETTVEGHSELPLDTEDNSVPEQSVQYTGDNSEPIHDAEDISKLPLDGRSGPASDLDNAGAKGNFFGFILLSIFILL